MILFRNCNRSRMYASLDTVFFLYDPAGYRDFPCFFRHPEVIGNERFRYGKNPTGILLPRSGYFSGRFRCNPGWKRRECTGIDTVSSRFLQDPDSGTIDLGIILSFFSYMLFFYIIDERADISVVVQFYFRYL